MAKKPTRKWEYRVSSRPTLQPGSAHPMMDNRGMEWWLNHEDEQGWEFVSYGQTRWADGTVQEWWIFRRPSKGTP